MTSKEKKEYLARYRVVDNEINDLLREKEKLMAILTRTTTELTGVPRGNGEKDKLSTGVGKLIELNRKIDEKIDHLANMRAEMVSCIDALPNDTYRRVLKLRYIEGLKWDSIADIMHYDTDGKRIFSLHGKALLALTINTEKH